MSEYLELEILESWELLCRNSWSTPYALLRTASLAAAATAVGHVHCMGSNYSSFFCKAANDVATIDRGSSIQDMDRYGIYDIRASCANGAMWLQGWALNRSYVHSTSTPYYAR